MKNTTLQRFNLRQNFITSLKTLFFAFLLLLTYSLGGRSIFLKEESKSRLEMYAESHHNPNLHNVGGLHDPCDGIMLTLTDPSATDINNLPSSVSAFKVVGDIYINPGETLTLTNKTVKMLSPSGTIYLFGDPNNTSNNGKIYLENTIIEGCDQMWGGIDPTDHCVISITENSQVNDMRYGIILREYGIYTFTGSSFLRNYLAVDATNKAMLLDYIFTLTCYENTIDGSGLKPWNGQNIGAQAIRGFQFKEAKNTPGRPIKVGQMGQIQNTFQNCQTGVYAEKSDFDIENTRFLGGMGRAIDIISSVRHTIHHCTFDYCVLGIALNNSYYQVLDNHFNHVGYCVAARHSRKHGADLPTISRNEVNGANDGFLLFFNDNSNPQITDNTDIENMGGTGIAIYDLDKAMPNRSTVSGNSLILKSGFGTPAAGTGSERGILILGTQKASVCDNRIEYDGEGLDFGAEAWVSTNSIVTNNDYVQTGSTPTLGSGTRAVYFDQSKFDCNYYTGNETALHLLGPCTNTDIATQHFVGPHAVGLFYQNASTKQQIHAGNAWEYSPGGGQFAALGVGIDPDFNLYKINCNDGVQFCPLGSVTPLVWFLDVADGNAETCDHSTLDCTLPPPLFSPTSPAYGEEAMIAKIMKGQLNFPNYTECLDWVSSQQALSWIVRHNLQNASTYSNYWSQNANTSAGKLAQLEADAITWEQGQVGLETQITSVWADIQQLSANSSLSPAQLAVLMQRYQDLDSLRAMEKAAQLAFVVHYRTVSAALPASHIFEENQKNANLILCDLYAREAFECTPSELDTLRSIAVQCPLEGGGAVLQARGLLELIVHEYYNTGSDCLNTHERNGRKPDTIAEVQISPNPSDGTFHLISPINGRTHLRLFDITGRIVWSKIVEGPEVYFTTTNVPSGCYFLDVRDSQNGELAIKRLIIH
ncbi:MAG: T9SS type A sorting domain-containing protein [Lewinellaceae bacterium]|nr:T9SS type A sorting domain-containing protein [Lewinellaceae bacterium]